MASWKSPVLTKDQDTLVRGTDPRIRIRTKMSWFLITPAIYQIHFTEGWVSVVCGNILLLSWTRACVPTTVAIRGTLVTWNLRRQMLWHWLIDCFNASSCSNNVTVSAVHIHSFCLEQKHGRQQGGNWQYSITKATPVSDLSCCLSASSCDNICFRTEACEPAMWQYLFLTWTAAWAPTVVTISASDSNVAIPVSAYCLSAISCGSLCFWAEAWVSAMWQHLLMPWTIAYAPAVVTIPAFELKLECWCCGNTTTLLDLQ